MDQDPTIPPVFPDLPISPLRRTLLSLLGGGVLTAGFAALAEPEPAAGKKKRKKKKKKKKTTKKKTCNGSVQGSASASEQDALLQMINDFRLAQPSGLQPLTRQSQLDSAAVAHSRDMVTRCYFAHDSPNGSDPGDRIAATGYQAIAWAENIYKGSGNLGSAAEAFDAWEKSTTGHRENMLSTNVSEIGIGTALDSAGFMNWTNVFGRRDI